MIITTDRISLFPGAATLPPGALPCVCDEILLGIIGSDRFAGAFPAGPTTGQSWIVAGDDDDEGGGDDQDDDDGFDDDDDLGIDDDGLAPAELEDFDEEDFDDDFDDDFEEEPDDFEDDGLGGDGADDVEEDDDEEFDIDGVPPPGEGGDLPEEELD